MKHGYGYGYGYRIQTRYDTNTTTRENPKIYKVSLEYIILKNVGNV